MKKIYEMIERGNKPNKISALYDIIIIIAVIISVLPLMFKNESAIFKYFDMITVAIFIVDYILGYITANYKIKKGKISFLIYPFTGYAIIDLLSILPSLYLINPIFKLFRILRVFKSLRIFKEMKFWLNFDIVKEAVKKEKNILISIFVLLVAYIFVSALVMFNVESEIFNNFFDAIYWSVIAVTTVGYGDISPITIPGKLVTMLSSLFGIAVIALPSGVITAGILKEIKQNKK